MTTANMNALDHGAVDGALGGVVDGVHGAALAPSAAPFVHRRRSAATVGGWLWELILRLLAPLVWRGERRIARKLEGFSATEAGSALDMLKAAELTCDPTLRRLFFRHAIDEARHARLFHDAACRLACDVRQNERDRARATRQNLFQTMSLTRFIAFVYLAEARGEAQFRALARHFARRPELGELFARIARDERFHVAYSRRLLDQWRADGRAGEVRRALLAERGARALGTWRRSGRVLGDAVAGVLLGVLYLVALPLFALVARLADPEVPGWQAGRGGVPLEGSRADRAQQALARARRQF
jgi:rubrerythrin